MKAPTPPRELLGQELDVLEVERKETIEIVLFEYEDEDVSFCISFEFVYTFTQEFETEQLLA